MGVRVGEIGKGRMIDVGEMVELGGEINPGRVEGRRRLRERDVTLEW